MKPPFPHFVLEWKTCRQPAKRLATYNYLKQISEASPNLEVRFVKGNSTQTFTAKEIVSKWKEICKNG